MNKEKYEKPEITINSFSVKNIVGTNGVSTPPDEFGGGDNGGDNGGVVLPPDEFFYIV